MRGNPLWPLAAIALGLLVLKGYGCARESQGELKQKIAAREAVIAALAKQKAWVDTEYVRAKATYRPLKARWDSVMATTDTTAMVKPGLTMDSIVRLRPETLLADSVIQSCLAVLLTCEHQVAIRDSLVANQATEIRALKRLASPARLRVEAGVGYTIPSASMQGAMSARAGVIVRVAPNTSLRVGRLLLDNGRGAWTVGLSRSWRLF